jgi:hypothetical protein
MRKTLWILTLMFFPTLFTCRPNFLVLSIFFKDVLLGSILFVHLFTCAYIIWVFSPLCPSPLPQFQAGPVLPLSLILVKKRHKPNKEGKVFLLVELWIDKQKYFWHCFRVHVL